MDFIPHSVKKGVPNQFGLAVRLLRALQQSDGERNIQLFDKCSLFILFLPNPPEQPGLLQCGTQSHVNGHGYDGGENGVDGGGRDVPGQGNVGGGLAQDQQLVEISHQRIGDHIENQPSHSGKSGPQQDFPLIGRMGDMAEPMGDEAGDQADAEL